MTPAAERATDAVLRRLQAARDRSRRGMTAGEIAELLGLEPAEVREALAALAKRGLLERDVDHDDRRVNVVWSARKPAEAE